MAVSTIDPNGLNVGQFGNRNLIINGSFRVSQRGDYTSASTMTHNVYMLDRWRNSVGVASTIQDLGGYVEIKATAASGASTARINQRFEDLYLLEGQTVTVSCEMKSNSTNGRLMMHNGSWVSTDATHSGSGQWESLSFTVTMPDSLTVTSVHVGIDGNVSADVPIAVGDYVQIKNVQLEVGDTATPFEHPRSYGDELARCQRYYRRIGNTGDASTYQMLFSGFLGTANRVYGSLMLSPSMRTQPTMGTTGTATHYAIMNLNQSTACSVVPAMDGQSSEQTIFLFVDTGTSLTAGGGVEIRGNNNVTAHIAFDAEL